MKDFTGIIYNGYGFIQKDDSVRVLNLMTMNSCEFPKPRTMINDHDLKLFAAGFVAGKDKGWGAVI